MVCVCVCGGGGNVFKILRAWLVFHLMVVYCSKGSKAPNASIVSKSHGGILVSLSAPWKRQVVFKFAVHPMKVLHFSGLDGSLIE